jgi:putative membrane protein
MSIRPLFLFWFAVGLLLMMTVGVPDWLAFSNGLFLVFFAAYALEVERGLGESNKTRWGRAAGLGAATFGIEVVGVATGWPFGEYEYTSVLGAAPLGVPLAIACAWVGVIANIVIVAEHRSRWLRALFTGLWVLVFDLVLDPVAYARDFWRWQHEGGFFGVPATNFAAWFAIAFILSLCYPRRETPYPVRREAVRLLQAMLLMFGLLGLKEGLTVPFYIAAVSVAVAEGVLRLDYVRSKRNVHASVRAL